MIIAKQYKTAKSRKISFDCETHSLSNDNSTSEKEAGSDTDTDNPQKEIEEDVMIPSLDDIPILSNMSACRDISGMWFDGLPIKMMEQHKRDSWLIFEGIF